MATRRANGRADPRRRAPGAGARRVDPDWGSDRWRMMPRGRSTTLPMRRIPQRLFRHVQRRRAVALGQGASALAPMAPWLTCSINHHAESLPTRSSAHSPPCCRTGAKTGEIGAIVSAGWGSVLTSLSAHSPPCCRTGLPCARTVPNCPLDRGRSPVGVRVHSQALRPQTGERAGRASRTQGSRRCAGRRQEPPVGAVVTFPNADFGRPPVHRATSATRAAPTGTISRGMNERGRRAGDPRPWFPLAT